MKENKITYPNLESCNPSSCVSMKSMVSNRIIANIFRKHLSPFGLTDSQLSILFITSKMKEVNQKKLSDVLFLEKSTVNRNLKRLLEKEFIIVENHFLIITKKGKELLEKVIPHWNKAMEETQNKLTSKGVDALNLLANQLTK